MNFKKITLVISLLLGVMAMQAQDKLYLKGQRNPLDVKVVEIGPDEVKVEDKENDVLQVYNTFDINKIVFANGRVQKFESEVDQTLDKYRDQNINAFSIDVAGALSNYIRVSYDRVLKPGMSYELAATYIGIDRGPVLAYYGTYDQFTGNYNKKLFMEPRGFRVEAGMKAIRLPNFVNGKIRYRHLLQGSYLKPWAAMEFVSQNYIDSITINQNNNDRDVHYDKRNLTSLNLGLDFGRSWVASNRILLDFYFGVGYSISNFKKINIDPYTSDGYDYFGTYYDTKGYGYLRTQPDRTAGFILRVGLKAGYVFNWKRDADKKFD